MERISVWSVRGRSAATGIFSYWGIKRGILYGKQKHDPRGRPGKAEQGGRDLQSPRGVLYQPDRGA